MDSMIRDIASVDGVRGVHDLHVWSITRALRTLSAHLVTDDIPVSEGASIQRRVNEILYHKYDVNHATLQLECEDCVSNLLYCTIAKTDHRHHAPGN